MKKKLVSNFCGLSGKLFAEAKHTSRAKVRCPECGRRLYLWTRWHDGGQEGVIDGLYWPNHKAKPHFVGLRGKAGR